MKAWEHGALCRRHDPDMWFPDGFARPQDIERAMTAQRICVLCPVAAECLAAAMAEEGSKSAAERHGIRAGLTPVERAAMVRAVQRERRKAVSV